MKNQDGTKTFMTIMLLALLTTAFCVMIIISRAVCGTEEERAPQSTSQPTSTQQQAERAEQTNAPSETQQAQEAEVEAESEKSTPEETFEPSDTAIPGSVQYYEEQLPSVDDMRKLRRKY